MTPRDHGTSDDASHDDASHDDASHDDASHDGARASGAPRRAVGTSHRGAFGTYGGDAGGALIERSFRERIVLVGVITGGLTEEDVDRNLDELELLVDTAGADVVDRVVQRRATPDPATFIGKGKAEELRAIAEHFDCDTVVFDDELTPAQQFKLEKLLGRTAIDRTAVILDIFGQNASSQEGKAQVELAQLRYRLPRLRGKGTSLSQQTAAIGLRGGPGETQLEIDRRRLQRRVHKLEAELRQVARHRDTQRKARRRSRLRGVSIVGYTNAGKSTLLNRLTDAGVLVEDRLFATLDATTRRLQLPGGEPLLLTDTVGFVSKLPHQLVEAFKSTLEVVADADLLVHLVDASGPDPEGNIAAVREVLAEIGAGSVPEVIVWNKADAADPDVLAHLRSSVPGSVVVSARTGEGVDELLRVVGDRLRALTEVVELRIPWADGGVLAAVHREGEVLLEVPGDDAMTGRARLEPAAASRFRAYLADEVVT